MLKRCLFALFLMPVLAGQAQVVDPARMWQQATLYRDEWGTPHIAGDNLRSMAFAAGYAQAEDHLAEMMLAYRVANGRAAEILGEAYASSDEFALRMGHEDLALSVYPEADAVTRDLCEGFAFGVNAYIVDFPDRVPPWVQGVRPVDVLSLLHCYLMSFAPFDLPEVWRRSPAAHTGNAWAVGPGRSKTGEPMLFINPHTDYTGFFRWYEIHVSAPGLDLMGATLYGLPLPLQGHNGILGWALTPNAPDTADVYVEPEFKLTRNPKELAPPRLEEMVQAKLRGMMTPKKYYIGSGGKAGEETVLTLQTPRGPVMGNYNDRLITWQAGGYRDFGALRQIYEMGRSRTLEEFQNALKPHQLPCFHIVYADRDGNIFYMYNAKVGDKIVAREVAAGAEDGGISIVPVDWDAPMPGDDPALNWGPIVAPDQLPMLTNPPSGFLQACGNPPWTATDMDAAVWLDAYPPWLIHDRDTYRARRVRALLRLGTRSFNDMQAMAYDVLVPFGLTAIPQLLEAADAHPEWVKAGSADLPEALEVLRNWNKVAESNSPGMTMFHVWWSAFRAMAPPFPTETDLYDAFHLNTPDIQRLSVQAASEAAKLMRNEFNSMSVPWGNVHSVYRRNDPVPVAGASSGEPVFMTSDMTYADGKWKVTYGYGYAMVVKFGERTEAVSMLPFGSSEDPTSPHYDDQLQLMAERRFKVTRFNDDDVKAHAERALGGVVRLRATGLDGEFVLHGTDPIEARMTARTEPPAPLPGNLAPFSVYSQPEWAPRNANVSVDAEIYIAPELCPQERLEELLIYTYDEVEGWTAPKTQDIDLETRTLRVRSRRSLIFAVLGPFDASPFAAQQLAQLDTQQSAVPGASPESAPPLQPSITQIPPESPVAESDTPDSGAVTQPMPTVLQPESAPEFVTPEPSPEPAPAPEPIPPAQPDMVEQPAPEPEDVESATAIAEVVEDTGTPGQTHVTGQRRRDKGAIGWGRFVELRPQESEKDDYLLSVGSDRTIGVRLHIFLDPPGMLPEGLAAYTDYFVTESSASDAAVDVTVSLQVPPEACAKEDLNQLKIYGYTPGGGWTALEEQSLNATTRDITGKDGALRSYAVLGPDRYRLGAGN